MSVKPELAFDVCWEVYRGAREVLETKRGISALNWQEAKKYLWRPDFRPRLNEWVADFALAGQAALGGSRKDFGIVRPEPLFLMDVRYPFSMDVILKHRVRDAWLSIGRDAELRVRLIQAWHRAALGES